MDRIEKLLAEAASYEPCMSLYVDQDSRSVELILDTSVSTYGEWIKGEGADICLLRCQDTKRVVGVRLPLMRESLSIFHRGSLRVNIGMQQKADQSMPGLASCWLCGMLLKKEADVVICPHCGSQNEINEP